MKCQYKTGWVDFDFGMNSDSEIRKQLVPPKCGSMSRKFSGLAADSERGKSFSSGQREVGQMPPTDARLGHIY